MSARAADLASAVHAAARKTFAVLDGPLPPIGRIAADRPHPSGKGEKQGMNLQLRAERWAHVVPQRE
ncbi:hypothetical protein [Streptomyces sp. NPDC093808]|uniref:hypothetical protein n=1 Tax=Streptomyces sp. NPDC093808 TaxID=3154985 RepID=UPI0034501526